MKIAPSDEKLGYTLTPEGPVWVFKNVLIKENGDIIPVAPEIPQKVTPIWAREGKPPIDVNADLYDIKNAVLSIPDLFNKKEIVLAIGWKIACYFSNEIFQKYRCFPMLNIVGPRESGKTTLVRWLMAFSGQQNCAMEINASTSVGVKMYLARYSNLSVWLDDYSPSYTQWNKFLCEVYRRTDIAEEASAGLVFSGETKVRDHTLKNACITLTLEKLEKQGTTAANYSNIRALCEGNVLSGLTLEVIKNRTQLLPSIMTEIEVVQKELRKAGVNQHLSFNYAVAVACYAAFFSDNKGVDVQWLKQYLKNQ